MLKKKITMKDLGKERPGGLMDEQIRKGQNRRNTRRVPKDAGGAAKN